MVETLQGKSRRWFTKFFKYDRPSIDKRTLFNLTLSLCKCYKWMLNNARNQTKIFRLNRSLITPRSQSLFKSLNELPLEIRTSLTKSFLHAVRTLHAGLQILKFNPPSINERINASILLAYIHLTSNMERVTFVWSEVIGGEMTMGRSDTLYHWGGDYKNVKEPYGGIR